MPRPSERAGRFGFAAERGAVEAKRSSLTAVLSGSVTDDGGGISTAAPHFGHFARVPRKVSGMFKRWAHCEQVTTCGMSILPSPSRCREPSGTKPPQAASVRHRLSGPTVILQHLAP